MLYALYQLFKDSDIPGWRLMNYITFRSGVAFVLSLLIALFIGSRIIDALRKHQIGETIRDLDLEGQNSKKGTPTMGGIIIIISILIPCLLIGNLSNVYMLLMIFATLWLGALGFLDDYKKLKKHDKEGLKGKYKIVGQIGCGLVVGLTMWLSPQMNMVRNVDEVRDAKTNEVEIIYSTAEEKAPETTIPFVKNHNFNYSSLTGWLCDNAETGGWIALVIITIFFVTATSNGANLTDGIDGLAAGTSAIIGCALAIMAYLGGNLIYAGYLNIMYLPMSGELVVYMAAFIGALLGFLWYNTSPAQVFMGDTGSLTLGGVIAVFAILIHKELLLPILCLIFYAEDLSVVLQVGWFKYTKRRTGTGRRIFKMTPLHHHFQKPGNCGIDAIFQKPLTAIKEQKITVRFWIIGIILAVITFVTLKIR